MKRYILDFVYITSLIIALFLLCTSVSKSQSDLVSKPAQIIKLSWNPSTDSDVWQYAIFYCQGADTNQFPIKNNVEPDSLWKSEPITTWKYATVYDLKFSVEPKSMPGTTYLRLGVCAINYAGKFGTIKCIPKVIKVSKPSSITNVKIY